MIDIVIPDSVHSRLSASSTHRWMSCPGSADFELQFDDKTGEAAAEGTVAHWIADHILTNGYELDHYIGHTFLEEGSGLTFECDEAMISALKVYIDYVKEVGYGKFCCYEHKIDMSDIHDDLGGTCDFTSFSKETGVLDVVDLKFGKGVIVEVKDNKQLQTYALGALKEVLKNTEWTADKIAVVTTIVQPRAPHKDGAIRSATYSGKYLIEDAEYIPGDHCTFCRATGACAARSQYCRDKLKVYFDDDGEAETPSVKEMSPKELADIIRHQDFIKQWLKDCVAYGTAQVEKGKLKLPGLKLTTRNTHRKWLPGSEETLAMLFGDELYNKKLKSPAQAEKLVKGKDKKLLAKYWETPVGGYTLVDRDSPKEEVVPESELEFLDSHDLLQ